MSAYTHAPHDASQQARTATTKMVGYLERLLTENDLHFGHYDRLWKILEAHRIWERDHTDGVPFDFDQASRTIDWVKHQVALKHASETQVTVTQDVPAGRYATPSRTGNNDLDFWKVDRPAEGKWAGRVFVNRVIGGQPDQPVRGSEGRQALDAIRAYGVMKAAQKYGQTIGECSNCGRHLTDDVSRERGFGPDCWAQRQASK